MIRKVKRNQFFLVFLILVPADDRWFCFEPSNWQASEESKRFGAGKVSERLQLQFDVFLTSRLERLLVTRCSKFLLRLRRGDDAMIDDVYNVQYTNRATSKRSLSFPETKRKRTFELGPLELGKNKLFMSKKKHTSKMIDLRISYGVLLKND